MKKLLIFLIAVFIIENAQAAVLLVNNATPGPGQYAQIDSAIADANIGDTIYVSGSSTPYQNCTIDKGLVLVGAGSFADKQNNVPTTIDIINIQSNVSDIVIEGFHITDGIKLGNKTNIHNVQIRFNFFDGNNDALNFFALSNSSNFFVNNNIFDHGGVVMYFFNTTAVSNLLIENNLIRGSLGSLNISNTTVKNNVFFNHSSGAFLNSNGVYATNVTIINNIFYNTHPSAYTVNCVFQNNITYLYNGTYPDLDTAQGNINNVNPLFVNVPNTVAFGIGYNYNLQAGSPAIGAGIGGTDMGFYGGSTPTSLRGEVHGVPVVRQMNIMNTNVPQNGNVNVKVRSTKAREN